MIYLQKLNFILVHLYNQELDQECSQTVYTN